MPTAPKRKCGQGDCYEAATYRGRCATHASQHEATHRQAEIDTKALFNSPRWKQARKIHLQNEPLCRPHRAQGQLHPGTVVDHIKPHRGDLDLFWDTTNWQTVCLSYHGIKSRHERK